MCIISVCEEFATKPKDGQDYQVLTVISPNGEEILPTENGYFFSVQNPSDQTRVVFKETGVFDAIEVSGPPNQTYTILRKDEGSSEDKYVLVWIQIKQCFVQSYYIYKVNKVLHIVTQIYKWFLCSYNDLLKTFFFFFFNKLLHKYTNDFRLLHRCKT